MSVQAGVLYFDRRPVPPSLTASISGFLAAFGPDGGGHHAEPGLVLVHRALHVAPEDRLERQPYGSKSGLVLTWDGRLDNRDDLLFELWRDVDLRTADVALAAATYEKWGDDGFRRLIGDWSVVLWDPQTGELKLASDYAGTRGLYYWEGDRALHWSTSLDELVGRLGLRDQLDTRFMVGYLASLGGPDLTPYVGVRSVSPGHVLTWSTEKGKRRHRYWDISVSTIRYADQGDYGIRLRSLFADAVGKRLRSTCSVWAELSGGFDSSAIVCMADRIVGAGPATVPTLHTVSYVTDSSPESDERPFITAVEDHRGEAGAHVLAETCVDVVDDYWPRVTPDYPSGITLAICQTVKRNGGRVLISGQMGDSVMGNAPELIGPVIEALLAAHPREFLSLAHQWCRACQRPIWHLVQDVVRELSPAGVQVRGAIRHFLRPFGPEAPRIRDAAAEAFLLTLPLAEIWCEEAASRARRVVGLACPEKRQLLADVLDFTELRWLQTHIELSPVLCTYPYSHRPLVEFMLAIPAGVICRPGEPRALMKEAFREILPSRVLHRFSKGYGDPLNLRKIRRWIAEEPRVLDRWHVVRRGYVDRDKLGRALDEIRNGSCRKLRNLERVFGLERWFQNRESGVEARACISQ